MGLRHRGSRRRAAPRSCPSAHAPPAPTPAVHTSFCSGSSCSCPSSSSRSSCPLRRPHLQFPVTAGAPLRILLVEQLIPPTLTWLELSATAELMALSSMANHCALSSGGERVRPLCLSLSARSSELAATPPTRFDRAVESRLCAELGRTDAQLEEGPSPPDRLFVSSHCVVPKCGDATRKKRDVSDAGSTVDDCRCHPDTHLVRMTMTTAPMESPPLRAGRRSFRR